MIYLDNSATSFPKAPGVIDEMARCMSIYCGNPGRSGHFMSVATGEKLLEARIKAAEALNVSENWDRIIFTTGTTLGLNIAIKGYVREGENIVTTSMEHNSVLRPARELEKKGISLKTVKADSKGRIKAEDIRQAIDDKTGVVAVTAASNVTGTITPLKEIRRVIDDKNRKRNRKIIFVVDGAQAGGVMPLEETGDIIAFPGHKGFLGPQGTGFMYIRKGIEIRPLLQGGTGTDSKKTVQPDELPEAFESGTLNCPGIIGMSKGIEYVLSLGVENIREHEKKLISILDEALHNMDKIKIYGPDDPSMKAGITSFNVKGKSCEEIAEILNSRYNIAVRAGYHCAPYAHKAIGSYGTGTVRVSVGVFNTVKDIRKLADALWKIAE